MVLNSPQSEGMVREMEVSITLHPNSVVGAGIVCEGKSGALILQSMVVASGNRGFPCNVTGW